MNRLDAYALTSASKIDEPWLNPSYCPIPSGKYIVFHSDESGPSKAYDYWQDVFYHTNKFLVDNNISVVQIGEQNSKIIEGVTDMRGISVRQAQFLIQHSLLLLGNDTISAHIASAQNKKAIILNAAVNENDIKPYWNESKVINAPVSIRPSYSLSENPKSINSIQPEVVAGEVLDELNISHDCHGFKTIFVGKQYADKQIDVIPNFPPTPQFHGLSVNLRLDLEENMIFAGDWANACNLNIITNKPLPLNFLKTFKSKILAVNCNVVFNFPKDAIKQMKSSGVNIYFYYRGKKLNLSKYREKYFDEHVHYLGENTFKAALNKKYSVFSHRKLYSREGIFLTEYHFSSKIPHEQGFHSYNWMMNESLDFLRIIEHEH